jgi:hypothetical protein
MKRSAASNPTDGSLPNKRLQLLVDDARLILAAWQEPVVEYHGLAHRHLRPFRLLVRSAEARYVSQTNVHRRLVSPTERPAGRV